MEFCRKYIQAATSCSSTPRTSVPKPQWVSECPPATAWTFIIRSQDQDSGSQTSHSPSQDMKQQQGEKGPGSRGGPHQACSQLPPSCVPVAWSWSPDCRAHPTGCVPLGAGRSGRGGCVPKIFFSHPLLFPKTEVPSCALMDGLDSYAHLPWAPTAPSPGCLPDLFPLPPHSLGYVRAGPYWVTEETQGHRLSRGRHSEDS